MDKSEINRRMAETVMKWQFRGEAYYWTDNEGLEHLISNASYNPAEDLNQAMMGVDKIMDEYYGCSFKLVKVNSCHDYRALIEPGLYLGIGDKTDKSPASAICLALLKVVEQLKKEN